MEKQETYDKREEGTCGCDRKDIIVKYTNSSLSNYDHKKRYTTLKEDKIDGNIEHLFRCSVCLKEIDNTFEITN